MEEKKNDKIPVDPEKKLPASLEKHLRGIIPESDLHHFREQLPAEFLSDASEGLHHIRDGYPLDSVLNQLNQQMHHQLSHKKTYRKRRVAGNPTSTYWAIIIIIFLAVVGFMLIRMTLKK